MKDHSRSLPSPVSINTDTTKQISNDPDPMKPTPIKPGSLFSSKATSSSSSPNSVSIDIIEHATPWPRHPKTELKSPLAERGPHSSSMSAMENKKQTTSPPVPSAMMNKKPTIPWITESPISVADVRKKWKLISRRLIELRNHCLANARQTMVVILFVVCVILIILLGSSNDDRRGRGGGRNHPPEFSIRKGPHQDSNEKGEQLTPPSMFLPNVRVNPVLLRTRGGGVETEKGGAKNAGNLNSKAGWINLNSKRRGGSGSGNDGKMKETDEDQRQKQKEKDDEDNIMPQNNEEEDEATNNNTNNNQVVEGVRDARHDDRRRVAGFRD